VNGNILAENLKKYRNSKSYTQEQVAAALHVTAQTVSRWECGTTLPDVLILPELARMYEVTVDDFYKVYSVAYDNYAQRLSAVYEKTRAPEDFLRCVLEYQRLMKSSELSTADKWNYAIIHHFMMKHCCDTAMRWYDKTRRDAPEKDPHSYYRACSCRAKLFFDLNMGDAYIQEQSERVRSNPENPREWDLMLQGYIYAERYNEAYAYFLRATEKFSDDWELYIHGGEICKALKRYDEAFALWDRAGEIGTCFCDELYCKAFCCADLGEYERAGQLYEQIADNHRRNGYDEEAEMAAERSKEMRQKITREVKDSLQA